MIYSICLEIFFFFRFPDSPSSPGFKRNSPSIMRRLKDFSLGGNRLSAAAAIELPTAPSYQSRMKSMVFDDAAVSFDESESAIDLTNDRLRPIDGV